MISQTLTSKDSGNGGETFIADGANATIFGKDAKCLSCKCFIHYQDQYAGWIDNTSGKHMNHVAQTFLRNGEANPPRKAGSLQAYIDDLRTRILGAQVPPEPYESLDVLYGELIEYYRSSLSLDELTPYLSASYTLLTHQVKNLDFIFQIYITGLKGSGKSTAGERLEKVCYQGFKTGCATFPFLVRTNEILGGMTQILDEFDLIANDEHVTKYLRGSTDRGNPYGLVEPVTIGGQTHSLPAVKMSFGPRILITSQQIRDEMVRDRSLEVVMMQYAGFLPEPSTETVNMIKAHLAHYREQVTLTVTLDDKRKWYEPKHTSGRLNEITTLLHLVTPPKYHDKIAAIIQREWEARTQLERESYAAKIVEALTAAVLNDDTRESTTGQIFIPVQEIKRHYDLRYADTQTGKGKTSPKSIGRVISNLNLRTDQFRVKDEEQRLRGWPLDKTDLVRIRQSLYLDEVAEFVSSVSSGSTPSAPLGIDTLVGEEGEHTLVNETNETNETKSEGSPSSSGGLEQSNPDISLEARARVEATIIQIVGTALDGATLSQIAFRLRPRGVELTDKQLNRTLVMLQQAGEITPNPTDRSVWILTGGESKHE